MATTKKKYYLTRNVADLTIEVFAILLTQEGQSAVMEYATKLNFPFHTCAQCETNTPTVECEDYRACGVCGQTKKESNQLF